MPFPQTFGMMPKLIHVQLTLPCNTLDPCSLVQYLVPSQKNTHARNCLPHVATLAPIMKPLIYMSLKL